MGETSPALMITDRRRSSRDLAKAIFNADSPEQFIRTIPAQSLLVAVKQTGLTDSIPLLEMVSIDQTKLLLDFDIWERDQFSEDRLWEWLSLSDDQTDFTLLQRILKSLDLKLIALLISRYVDVVTFEDQTENPPGEGFYTPDKGHTWIHLKIPDSTRHFLLARFLALVFETSAEIFYQLLSIPGVATDSGLEEEALQDRNKRLLAEGIPDMEFATVLLAPVTLAAAQKELKTAAKRVPIEGIRAVEPMIFDTPCDKFMKELLEIAGEALEEELTLVLNAAIVKFNTDFAEVDELMALVSKVKGAISIGIETALNSGNGGLETAAVYRALGLAKLFGLGFNSLQQIRTQARKIPDEAIRKLDAGDALFSIVAGLRESFPQMPKFVLPDGTFEESDGRLTAGFKAIESAQELKVLQDLLARF